MGEMWQFTKVDRIENLAFDDLLRAFFEMKIEGTVRENIQNSLDAALFADEPVEVSIKIGHINQNKIPGIDEISDHIESLTGSAAQTRNTIERLQKSLTRTVVRYISFEDRNTKGLSNADQGERGDENSTWVAYSYIKGKHVDEEDANLEQRRGGSFGVGKIASNAMSDAHMMFFANCDEKGNKHLGGTIQLIEHELNGVKYRATGYFSDLAKDGEEEYLVPFENTNNFDEIFNKNTRGLKIIIPFLNNKVKVDDVIRSVCKNFFLAILEKNLIVSVNGIRIDDETIREIMADERYFNQEGTGNKESFYPLYLNTYEHGDLHEFSVKSDNNLGADDIYRFRLHLVYDKNIRSTYIAVVRTIGMKIEDLRIKNNKQLPLNAVLIPLGEKEDSYLKSLENASHTALDHKHIADSNEASKAKTFIEALQKEIIKIFDQEINKRNPTEGAIDTSDLFYTHNFAMGEALKKQTNRTRITHGQRGDQRLVQSIRTGGRTNTARGSSAWRGLTENRRIRRAERRNPRNENRNRVRYDVKSQLVKRIVTTDREVVLIDLKKYEDKFSNKRCDVYMVPVTGEGTFAKEIYLVRDNYSSIKDAHEDRECNTIENGIKGVSIKNGEIRLELRPKEGFNPTLKFLYYVEA